MTEFIIEFIVGCIGAVIFTLVTCWAIDKLDNLEKNE